MKLLIITQSVNRDNHLLAFFEKWLVEFAKSALQVTVICLEKGRIDLPQNIKVFSLHKEANPDRVSGFLGRFIKRMRYVYYFYKYIFTLSDQYDAVFVHMNPIYVVLGGLYWRLTKKKIALWYTHRQVDWKLRIAEKFANVVFTASAESFLLPSKKIKIVGHGIDADRFAAIKKHPHDPFNILHVGRVTPIKNCDILIEAAKILQNSWNKKFQITFVGQPVLDSDFAYLEVLKSKVKQYGLTNVTFAGSVDQNKIVDFYASADITVNLTPTGGVDKAVLESMAAGVPVLTSNKTFVNIFEKHWSDLIFEEKNAEDLSKKIVKLAEQDLHKIGEDLQKIAREKASVTTLIPRLVREISR